MVVLRVAAVAACLLVLTAQAPMAIAEPDAAPEPVADAGPAADAAPAPDDGRVESAPPATTKTPDGWELKVWAKDETQLTTKPLTTALSSREYLVGGIFTAAMTGPDGTEEPQGVLDVGYQIGCGIDMSTSNGVTLTGSVGMTPSIGLIGIDAITPLPEAIGPALLSPVTGGIAIGLKPGFINIVPVAKKEYRSAEPWVMVSGFRVQIDGCVGESFLRSYAILTKSTDSGDAVLGYYGVTKKV